MRSAWQYDTYSGTAGDDFTVINFTRGVCNFITFEITFQSVYVEMSYDGETFGGELQLFNTQDPRTIPFACRAVRIRNRIAGANATYNVVAFYY